MNINSVHNENSLKNQKSAEVEGNISTSSADSGVIITDNNKNQLYQNNKLQKSESDCNYKENNIKSVHSSPCASLRSLSISIVSIDDNNSSVVDSDFETDTAAPENQAGKQYVIHKLGTQTTYPAGGVQIPQLHQGLRVVSQVISQNDQISEEFRPNAVGAGAVGAIAVTNSSDVTFGDKHYYEGPVTIQQFLIDSREKEAQNEGVNGETNAGFMGDKSTTKECSNDPTSSKAFTKNSSDDSSYFGGKLSQRKICYLFLMLLGLLAAILTVFYTLIPNDMRTTENIVEVNNKTLRIIKREGWHARPPSAEMANLNLPVSRVIIAHTATEMCESDFACIERMRIIQDFHMDSRGWADIGYNFVIGGAGQVLIGRDWPLQGAHTLGYNADSIGVAFIGTYDLKVPFPEQIEALELLLEWGVQQHKLIPNYRLYGAKQLMATVSPGAELYNLIKKFPHWSSTI